MKHHRSHAPGAERPIPPERRLQVAEVRNVLQISPHMQRITLGAAAFMDFPVRRPAQWVKLFVPGSGSEKPSGRAYTIRHFREESGEMDIDFVLHADGPCSTWAQTAKPGDLIQIAGPRSGFRLDPNVTHLLIGGDETALPAIGSILEALPAGLAVDVFIEIPEDNDVQIIPSKADVDITWLPRNGTESQADTTLATAMMLANVPLDNSAVWFAAEAAIVRTVRQHFQIVGTIPRHRITMSGYWKKGEIAFRDPERD